MRKGILKSVLVIGAIFGVCMVLAVGQAQATLSDPIEGPVLFNDGNLLTYFNDTLGNTGIIKLDEDFPVDVGEDEGLLTIDSLSNSYDEELGTNDEPNSLAYITWGSGVWYIAVKDGNANGSGIDWVYYIVAEDQRDGDSGIVSTDANGGGAISNIRAYGPGTSVPDASVMLLLGSSLLGFAVFTRKRKNS